MKKQLFLLTSLLIASTNFYAATCKTDCKTSCSTKSKSCKDVCVPEHGKTFRRVENAFQNATPVYASQFNSNVLRNLDADDKHGGMEITVFGGKNTKKAESGCYFFPYGHSQYTFSGDVTDTVKTHAAAIAFSTAGGFASNNTDNSTTAKNVGTQFNRYAATTFSNTNGADGYLQTDPVTFKYDSNKDTSKILPWNFGITFAALFEPQGALGLATGEQTGKGLVTSPKFKATVNPEYYFSHVGAGLALRYHFSDDRQGFFGSLSTSVEHVRSRMCLNENVVTEKTEINGTNFPINTTNPTLNSDPIADLLPAYITFSETPATNPIAVTGSDPLATGFTGSIAKGSINQAYLNGGAGTYFPVDVDVTNGGGVAPKNVTEAFAQSAWKYGKIDCEQKITRLADIELAVGYQWLCSDCASSNWYVGVVIPTGNKPCADYVAPAVVGNGQHGGIMGGSSLELMLSENEDRAIWYRLDTNCRYLFRNTQKRSFDLKGNEWSRYMMVWDSKESYEAAITNVLSTTAKQPNRNYEPGINVFTHDMKVKPRFQSRINQAVYFNSECFRAEMGWNVFARTKECVEFSCPWDKKPAFADASGVLGIGLNNNRTIYNDAQLMSVNQSLAPNDGSNTAAPSNSGTGMGSIGLLNGLASTTLSTSGLAEYDDFSISEKDVNLDSASTPASIVHTPYATLGYAWDSECKPALSVGAQYEFSQGNTALNKWMVWGKFEFAF